MNQEILKIKSLLKQIIKDRALSYLDVAKKLNLSEATVKRLLNGNDISLNSLISLCDVLDINFYDLFEQSRTQVSNPYQFTLEQEEYFSQSI